MITGFFLVAVLGFLFFEEQNKKNMLKLGYMPSFKNAIKEGIDLFLTVFLIFVFHYTLRSFNNALYLVESFYIAVVPVLGYTLSRYQKKGNIFFIAVICVYAFVMNQATLFQAVSSSFLIAVGAFLFCAFMSGFRQKIKLLHIPTPMKGIAIYLLVAFFIALIFTEIMSVVF